MDENEGGRTKKYSVSIYRVSNGYTVGTGAGSMTDFVFETFEGLIEWMRENLQGADS